jgi:hypothetical protein
MKDLFQDEMEDEMPYHPEGIISLLNYDQYLSQNKITIMWKSPKGVAYESTLKASDIVLVECTVDEYKEASDDIDYVHNNNIQRMLEDTMFSSPELKKPQLSIVKDPNND